MAGCAGQGLAGNSEGTVDFSDGAASGGIQGLVVDSQFVPVPGAVIFVDGEERARSDASGEFRVSPLAAGQRLVAAEKENYLGTATSVTVQEGALATVTLVLEILPGKSPYVSVVIRSGQIQCGAAATIPSVFTNGHIAVCAIPGLVGLSTGEQFRTEVELGLLEGTSLTGLWGETTWQSTQAIGKGMKVIWWLAEPGANDLNGRYRDLAIVTGLSPLRVRILVEKITDPDAPRQICQKTSQCLARATHYASANTTGALVDVGLTIQQRYTDYYSLFFNAPLPEQYTAVPDS